MAVGFASVAYGLESLAKDGFVDSLVQNVFGCLANANCLRIKPVIRILLPGSDVAFVHAHMHVPHALELLAVFPSYWLWSLDSSVQVIWFHPW